MPLPSPFTFYRLCGRTKASRIQYPGHSAATDVECLTFPEFCGRQIQFRRRAPDVVMLRQSTTQLSKCGQQTRRAGLSRCQSAAGEEFAVPAIRGWDVLDPRKRRVWTAATPGGEECRLWCAGEPKNGASSCRNGRWIGCRKLGWAVGTLQGDDGRRRRRFSNLHPAGRRSESAQRPENGRRPNYFRRSGGFRRREKRVVRVAGECFRCVEEVRQGRPDFGALASLFHRRFSVRCSAVGRRRCGLAVDRVAEGLGLPKQRGRPSQRRGLPFKQSNSVGVKLRRLADHHCRRREQVLVPTAIPANNNGN